MLEENVMGVLLLWSYIDALMCCYRSVWCYGGVAVCVLLWSLFCVVCLFVSVAGVFIEVCCVVCVGCCIVRWLNGSVACVS